MGDSMLVYSEKMRRISRNRFQHGSTAPVSHPQISGVNKHQKRTLKRDTDDETKPAERKPGRPLRSLSDAASYKSLRGRHLLKPKKKCSLDMTGSDLKIGHSKISSVDKDCGVISSAWEEENFVYERHRRRGVTVVPQLEALAINDKPVTRSGVDHDDYCLPNIGDSLSSRVSPRLFDQLSVDNFSSDDSRTVKCKRSVTDDLKTKYDLFKCDVRPWHSTQSIWDDISSGRVCPESSEISQIVLKSFADDDSISSDSPLPVGKISDTSAAELKLLERSRNRLSSSSPPSSPFQSSDEEDDRGPARKRTQSLSLPRKPLKSVLKKSNSFAKKNVPIPNAKSVSFKSQDTIRVISRCSGDEWDVPMYGSALQSKSTIVVIRDY